MRACTNYSLHTDIADDITGHRLKSSSNKTRETFNAFRTQRRIILSGTPIQNDLREFHAMVIPFLYRSSVIDVSLKVDFCNPGLLGMSELPRMVRRALGLLITYVR